MFINYLIRFLSFLVHDCAKPNSNGNKGCTENVFKSVLSMTENERKLLLKNLKTAEEVTLSMIYKDGSSLLRPRRSQEVIY